MRLNSGQDGHETLAAGGVVVRRGPGGPEVLLVHRPRYDDWSLPKGKVDPGESFEAAAEREVREETGLVCRRLRELPAVVYRDAHGRRKRVRYWLMQADGGNAALRTPDDEVDVACWLAADEALARLTYPRDRKPVEAAIT